MKEMEKKTKAGVNVCDRTQIQLKEMGFRYKIHHQHPTNDTLLLTQK